MRNLWQFNTCTPESISYYESPSRKGNAAGTVDTSGKSPLTCETPAIACNAFKSGCAISYTKTPVKTRLIERQRLGTALPIHNYKAFSKPSLAKPLRLSRYPYTAAITEVPSPKNLRPSREKSGTGSCRSARLIKINFQCLKHESSDNSHPRKLSLREKEMQENVGKLEIPNMHKTLHARYELRRISASRPRYHHFFKIVTTSMAASTRRANFQRV